MNLNAVIARLGWTLPAITVILSSLTHLLLGDYRAFPFLISEADYPGLQRYIFTIGFFLSGIILIYLSWKFYKSNKDDTRWYWIHLSLICGIIIGINLSIMAFMNMYDHLELHILTASNVFQFGLAWGILSHLAFENSQEWAKKLRYFSISLGFFSFFMMLLVFNMGIQENPQFIDNEWDLDTLQPYINWAAPLEYMLVASFILTLVSFEDEMSRN